MEEEQEEAVTMDTVQGIVTVQGMNQFMSEDDAVEMRKIRNFKCRCKKPFAGLGCTHIFSDKKVFEDAIPDKRFVICYKNYVS